MGLHIYFCDICGVRVTDVDLRSGHGLLRGQQVLCGTCLGMGHGKAWLEQVEPARPPRDDPAERLAEARDRAVTVPDPVQPPRLDTKDTVRVPTPLATADLSAVAQSLGAMTSASRPVDDPLAEDVIEQAAQANEMARPEHPEAPFAPPAEDAEGSSALQRAARSSGGASSSAARRAAAGSGRVPREPGTESGRRAPTASGRPGSARQSKAGRAPGKTSSREIAVPSSRPPLPLLVSIVSVVVIAVGTWMYLHGGSGKSGQGQVVDLAVQRDQVEESIAAARKAMNDALETHELAQLRAAHDKFRAAQERVSAFADLMVQKGGWTEDQVGYHLSNLRFEDLQSKDKAIRDELVKHHAP